MNLTISRLDADAAREAVSGLAAVLADCVAGGASVSFMHPFGQADAETYYAKVAAEVAAGVTVLLAARVDGRILGTVQLGLDTPPNQPHRADVKKMLVHRDGRRRGLGEALMGAIEAQALAEGRWLLVLDTVTGLDGDRLYRRCGWTEAGAIPDYALTPDGTLCPTTVFWKRLESPPA